LDSPWASTLNQSFFCPSSGSKKCKKDCLVCATSLKSEKSSTWAELRRRYSDWRDQKQFRGEAEGYPGDCHSSCVKMKKGFSRHFTTSHAT
jgi:hypothetical protein